MTPWKIENPFESTHDIFCSTMGRIFFLFLIILLNESHKERNYLHIGKLLQCRCTQGPLSTLCHVKIRRIRLRCAVCLRELYHNGVKHGPKYTWTISYVMDLVFGVSAGLRSAIFQMMIHSHCEASYAYNRWPYAGVKSYSAWSIRRWLQWSWLHQQTETPPCRSLRFEVGRKVHVRHKVNWNVRILNLWYYTSFTKESINCFLCKRNTDDCIKYGEKLNLGSWETLQRTNIV